MGNSEKIEDMESSRDCLQQDHCCSQHKCQRLSSFVLGNSYNSEERIVCAGYDNGDIKMFDLKTMSLRWETNVKNGVSPHRYYICLI